MDNLNPNEEIVDSIYVSQLLGITSNNLRQLVFRKLLVPVGKEKRRSLFRLADVLRMKEARTPIVPSA
jgi:DNA-binding transcriptional MerR regulator